MITEPTLPISEEKLNEISLQQKSANHQALLVIDDEPLLIELIRDVYGFEGITVYGSSEIKESLLQFEKFYESIRFVILDLNIPGTTTEETIQYLVSINPSVKIVLTSGNYIQDGEYTQPQIVSFLHKPYDPDQLITLYDSIKER